MAGLTNPFPGIRSYESDEATLFFGRERQVEDLLTKLPAGRFLAVIGSSGCGKSSLIQAGLIPTLQGGQTSHFSSSWDITVFRPGRNPLLSMARALSALLSGSERKAGVTVEEIEQRLRFDSSQLVAMCAEHRQGREHNILIVLDQFEEVFRLGREDGTAGASPDAGLFVGQLLCAIAQQDVPVYFVLSMRSDFLDACTQYPGLPEVINAGSYLVPRMAPDEVKRAIAEPIRAGGAVLAPQLLERLLADLGESTDQLPVLQHALMRTWDYWESQGDPNAPIDLKHYTAVGTLANALSYHAEDIYNTLLRDRDKAIAARTFRALISVVAEGKETRRPVKLSRLCAIVEADEEKVVDIVDHFRAPGRAFLTPSTNVPLTPDSIIDISHESIMRIWDRMREWVEEEKRSAGLYMRLSKSAELHQKGEAGLWVNPELQLGLNWMMNSSPNAAWAEQYDPAFERAATFLQRSKEEYERELTEKEMQQQRRLMWTRRFAFFLGGVSVISLLFLVIAVQLKLQADGSREKAVEKERLATLAGRNAERQRREALAQKRIAEQQQLMAEQQRMLTEEQKAFALQQKERAEDERREAVRQKEIASDATAAAIEAREVALVAKDEAERQRLEAVEQRKIADAQREKAVMSEQRARRLRLLAVARSVAVQSVEMASADKSELPALLAVAASRLHRANEGEPNDPTIFAALAAHAGNAVVLRGHTDAVRGVAVGGTGAKVFTCSDDGTARLWDLTSESGRSQTLSVKGIPGAAPSLRCAAVTVDGSRAAAGTATGAVCLWNLSDPQAPPRVVAAHGSVVRSVSFSPDGRVLASTASDRAVFLWNVSDGSSAGRLRVDQSVNQAAYDPTGRLLACCTEEGTVLVYSTTDLTSAPAIVSSSGEPLRSIAVGGPDGRMIAAGSSKGIIYLWKDAPSGGRPQVLLGHASSVTDLDLPAGTTMLASCSYDGTVRLWDWAKADQQPIVVADHDGWVYGVALAGGRLVSAGADKTVRVRSTRTDEFVKAICGQAGRSLSLNEWNKYVGTDIEYEKSCADK